MATKAEWEKLKEQSLKKFGEESIFGEGSLNSRLAVVGEAPGKHEVEEAGIDRSKLYVTNVVKVRPTKEGGGSTVNRPPRAGEIREGIVLLKEELDLVKPRALALLGSTPAKAIMKKSFTLKSEHGTIFDTEFGMPALATYHPAYLLRLRGVGSEDYDRMRQQVVDDLGAAWVHAQGSHDC